MSAWFAALGGLMIAVGVYTTWRDSRFLLLRRYWRGDLTRAARRTRRTALTSLRSSLFYIAIGLNWLMGWYRHPIFLWLLAGYLFVWLIYDLSTWIRARRGRKPGGQTA